MAKTFILTRNGVIEEDSIGSYLDGLQSTFYFMVCRLKGITNYLSPEYKTTVSPSSPKSYSVFIVSAVDENIESLRYQDFLYRGQIRNYSYFERFIRENLNPSDATICLRLIPRASNVSSSSSSQSKNKSFIETYLVSSATNSQPLPQSLAAPSPSQQLSPFPPPPLPEHGKPSTQVQEPFKFPVPMPIVSTPPYQKSPQIYEPSPSSSSSQFSAVSPPQQPFNFSPPPPLVSPSAQRQLLLTSKEELIEKIGKIISGIDSSAFFGGFTKILNDDCVGNALRWLKAFLADNTERVPLPRDKFDKEKFINVFKADPQCKELAPQVLSYFNCHSVEILANVIGERYFPSNTPDSHSL